MPLPFPDLPFQWDANPDVLPGAAYGPGQQAVLNADGLALARRCIGAWPGYAPTPLVALPGLAAALGLGGILYKQEGDRFGLRSFKPLGGAYAVQRCLMRAVEAATGRPVDPDEILRGDHADIVAAVTVTAATDGNHGRSVAWGARMFGCRCVIFINEAVTEARETAIAAYGAQVRRHPGTFDDAVRAAFAAARREGWSVIPDTTDGQVVEAPRDVTQGYAVMGAEIIEQLAGGPAPSHLFLQAGVGGMAAATCAEFWRHYGADRPTTVLVEPEQCACWHASLTAGTPTAVTGDVDSFMSGLACGEPSALAWEILHPGAHAAMTLNDDAAPATMRLLAQGWDGDPPLVGGESGVAGLAGLITAARDAGARAALGLDETSRAVVIGSEGATDAALYEQVVGRPWQEVA
ncbi:MAG: diaminopropionate ammonia-lyase [Rhodobacterales bacterium]|nr:diaminopropionate ammonia-lyase [Rhodobacterales bacterium]